MNISKRVGIGFALIILLIGAMFTLQIATEEWLTLNPPENMMPIYDTGETQSFTKDDFNYGPQKNRPYKELLPIAVSEELKDTSWYLMFVNANVTPPYGGNPHLGRTGYVEVTYDFENLAGSAAFHVLGLQGVDSERGSWRTNRIEGWGSSGLFVSGDSTPGYSMGSTIEMTDFNNILVQPAGVRVDFDDMAPVSYYIHFDPQSGGLNSLHISQDLSMVKGDMIYRNEDSGSFYVTHSGGGSLKNIVLIVGVNEKQPDDFSLRLDTKFVRTQE